jgi:Methyltransferase domain
MFDITLRDADGNIVPVQTRDASGNLVDVQPSDADGKFYPMAMTSLERRAALEVRCELCLGPAPGTLAETYRHRSAENMDIRAQMPVLYAWAHQPAVKIIECGTRGGYSACAFLAGIERADTGGQLWSVDIEEPWVPRWWHEIPFWHQITADSVSPEALAFCPDQVDIVFSDTSHFYDQTLGELLAYAPKVRPGGLILVHDVDAVENATAMVCPEVPPAMDEFCRQTGLTWYMHPGWNGLGVVEIPR